jgi:RNA polymerase subunit RPABC4/transcription elongation factor Spt4
MEAKFMILQVENFLTDQERAGRINKDARRELEEAKRHFREGDYGMSLALSARAKRASGQTGDFVKVREKEEGKMAEGTPDIEGVPTGPPPPPTSKPVARPSAPTTRPPAPGARPCASCGAVVEPRDKFCRECGTPSARACPKCGETFGPNDRFCGQCGTKA